MDDDDEIFNVVSKPVETKQPVPSNGFDSGLGGFSFETGSALSYSNLVKTTILSIY